MAVMLFGTLAALALCLPKPAVAQTEQPLVDITLTPETTTIQPGETLTVAIEQDIEPGWHTYWVNPGDSGEPMAVRWTMPDGFTAESLRWPVPHKITIGPLVSYGYKNRAIILQDIQVPSDIADGPITLTADIELLVCEEICIPEFSTKTLTLNDPAVSNRSFESRIAQAKAAMPYPWPGAATFRQDNGDLVLTLTAAEPTDLSFPAPVLIPHDWGIVDGTAETRFEGSNRTFTFTKARGDRPLSAIETFRGLITYTTPDGTASAVSFTAHPTETQAVEAGASESGAANRSKGQTVKTAVMTSAPPNLAKALFFAFLGGLILNLMPCVFPVLSLKALKLCKLKGRDLKAARLDSLLYTLGILVSFALFAGVIIALQIAGTRIGWGFQLQNATFVIVLAWLLFLIGLNLSGFYEIGGRLTGIGSGLIQGHDHLSAFFTGVLAAVVATPCTAPFMGVAVGYALTQPFIVTLIVFLTLGLGLAAPYIALALSPRLRRFLPQPGQWMVTFKQFLAFPLYASAIWLVWVALQQGGTVNLIWALSGALLLTFALWLYQLAPSSVFKKLVTRTFAVLAVILALGLLAFVSHNRTPASVPQQDTTLSGWAAFSKDTLATALDTDYPVFINMTADWCITCKVNERVALDTRKTKALFKTHNVRTLKGDWTNYDPEITAYLDSFGRNGVPLYVFYPAPTATGNNRPPPVILPQILTPVTLQNLFTE